MTVGLGTNLEYNRIVLGIITLTFFLPVLFDSILGLWVTQSVGPGVPGSVRGGLFLLSWF